MRSLRSKVLLCLVLAAAFLVGAVSSPEPARAWAVCHEGTYDWAEWHCYLGRAADCTECWVTPV